MNKFSIIVPMYNVEKYIEECIESVIAQTYSNWELVLVDDGSCDRSLQIAQQYEKSDGRIKAISKTHGGPAQTRNVGLQYISGDYLALLDGDDYWHPQHLEKVNMVVGKYACDMCIMNNHTNFTETSSQNLTLFPVGDKSNEMCLEDALNIIFDLNNHLPAAAVLTIYKVDFLVNNKIVYGDQYYCSEDLDFFLQCIARTSSIKFCSHEFYYYRQDHQESLTKNISGVMLLERLNIYKKWFDFYENKRIGCFNCKKIQALIARDMPLNISNIYGVKDIFKSDIKAFFIKNSYIWCPISESRIYFHVLYIRYWLKFQKGKVKRLLLGIIKNRNLCKMGG